MELLATQAKNVNQNGALVYLYAPELLVILAINASSQLEIVFLSAQG
jgi:hypothetical protein